MIVDTSALVRVFLAEPGHERFDRAMADQLQLIIPMPCFVEFALLRRLGSNRMEWLEMLTKRDAVSVANIDADHRGLAVDAAMRYGKGSGHPAQLNFGDCLVYAVARHRDLPLLFAGDDFIHTDVTPVLPPET